jgi:hypothetical protein
MTEKGEQGATSDPQERGLPVPPTLETEDIYKVERFGDGILWRATIGGVAGYWLLVMLLAVRSVDYYGNLIIWGIHFSIVSGAVGMFIGGTLRFYYRKYGRNLGIIMRVIVGVSIAILIFGIIGFITSDNFSIGGAEVVRWFTSSIFIGGLSGLVARLKKDATSRSPAS